MTVGMCLASAGLSEAAAGLVMPGYEPSEEAAARQNLEGHTPHMAFQPHLKYTPGCNFKLSEAVQASCSAPTFFPGQLVKVHDMCKQAQRLWHLACIMWRVACGMADQHEKMAQQQSCFAALHGSVQSHMLLLSSCHL